MVSDSFTPPNPKPQGLGRLLRGAGGSMSSGREDDPNEVQWVDWGEVLFHADVSPILQKYVVKLYSATALRCTCKKAPPAVAFKPKEALELLKNHGTDRCGLAAHAAVEGDLFLLQFAMRRGCNASCVCRYAAQGGRLEILKWAREHGFSWDESTCSQAARHGYLEVVKWARAQGCPWDENTCALAAIGGHLEVVKWARAHGCPE